MDILDTLASIAADLTAALSAKDRYQRLLGALRRIIPFDAAALLRLEGEALIPLAAHGLLPDAMGRRYARSDHPRLDSICNSSEPYIPMLKESNVRKGFFEHGDFLALCDALPYHLKGFVTFAYKVGWRLSEIAGLTWKQVDLIQGIVRLEAGETKNDEARTVYLDDELKEIIKRQWEFRKECENLLP